MTLVDPAAVETISVLGPTIQFITPPDICGDGPCVMRGTIPAGVVVPLHSHRDPETFLLLAGAVEALEHSPDGFAWLITSTSRIGAFFREIATPNGSWPPSPDALRHFLATAERYGYWNATPAENAEVGITLRARGVAVAATRVQCPDRRIRRSVRDEGWQGVRRLCGVPPPSGWLVRMCSR